MSPPRSVSLIATFMTMLPAVMAQQQVTIPAAYDVQDAPTHLWVPGTSGAFRLQTLVAPSLTGSLAQRVLAGIELRRSVRNEAFAGGSAHLIVRVSTATTTVDTTQPVFGANHGPDVTTVFAGTVAFPASPAAPGPTVGWDAANTIAIQFQHDFPFAGGTLCVDICGTPAGSPVPVWAADAVEETVTGSTAAVGAGCGPWAQGDGRWAFLDDNTLVAGARARMVAYGTPNALAFLAVSDLAVANAQNLAPLMPGCHLHLLAPFYTAVSLFGAGAEPFAATHGSAARHELPVPNEPWVLSLPLACQWWDVGAMATSNAVVGTIAAQPPTMLMSTVTGFHDGAAEPAAGRVSRTRAHVMRFQLR